MATPTCEKCKATNSLEYDKDTDEWFCTKCWYTQEQKSSNEAFIDADNPEFNPELDQASPITKDERGIKDRRIRGTVDADGNPVSSDVRDTLERINKIEKFTQTPFEKAIVANEQLRRNMLNLIPDAPAFRVLRDTFKTLHQKVIEKKLQSGRNANLMALATLIVSYRLCRYRFSWKDIKEYEGLEDKAPRWGNDKTLFGYYGKIISKLNIDTTLFYK
jgi:transcription initiation factor TFIIIB Brf1 subunit/transcription initiation factor TFIIB